MKELFRNPTFLALAFFSLVLFGGVISQNYYLPISQNIDNNNFCSIDTINGKSKIIESNKKSKFIINSSNKLKLLGWFYSPIFNSKNFMSLTVILTDVKNLEVVTGSVNLLPPNIRHDVNRALSLADDEKTSLNISFTSNKPIKTGLYLITLLGMSKEGLQICLEGKLEVLP